jgi:hypothetical protein
MTRVHHVDPLAIQELAQAESVLVDEPADICPMGGGHG